MTQRFSLYEDLTRAREPALLRRHLRRAARAAGARASTRCSSARASASAATSSPARCRAAGSSGSRSPARPSTSRRCCSSTSRPRASIRSAAATSGSRSTALAAEGTTVLLTTHYMDEAERCHRLAFIFRGALLDVGTPEEIVERRAPARRRARGRARRARPPTACARDPRSRRSRTTAACCAWRRAAAPIPRRVVRGRARRRAASRFASCRDARVTVEDAFVSMVRDDERAARSEGEGGMTVPHRWSSPGRSCCSCGAIG